VSMTTVTGSIGRFGRVKVPADVIVAPADLTDQRVVDGILADARRSARLEREQRRSILGWLRDR